MSSEAAYHYYIVARPDQEPKDVGLAFMSSPLDTPVDLATALEVLQTWVRGTRGYIGVLVDLLNQRYQVIGGRELPDLKDVPTLTPDEVDFYRGLTTDRPRGRLIAFAA